MRGESRCPVCLVAVAEALYCPGCRRAYHEACYRQNRCVLDDCSSVARKKVRAPAEPASSHLWTRAGWLAIGFLVWWGVTYALASGPSHPVTRVCLGVLSLIAVAVFGTLTAAAVHELLMAHGDERRPDFVGTMAVALHLGWMWLITIGIFVEQFGRIGPEVGQVWFGLGCLLMGGGFLLGFVGLFVDRLKTRCWNVVACGGIVGVLAAILAPSRPRASPRANTRACYANQKTIVGAIEMYNLDKNTKRDRLDASFFESLKSGGYLQSIPSDPGEGPGTSGHYRFDLTGPGNGMFCTVHGSIQ